MLCLLFGGESTDLFLFPVQLVGASVDQCMALCARFRVGRVWSSSSVVGHQIFKHQFFSWMNLVFESIKDSNLRWWVHSGGEVVGLGLLYSLHSMFSILRRAALLLSSWYPLFRSSLQ